MTTTTDLSKDQLNQILSALLGQPAKASSKAIAGMRIAKAAEEKGLDLEVVYELGTQGFGDNLPDAVLKVMAERKAQAEAAAAAAAEAATKAADTGTSLLKRARAKAEAKREQVAGAVAEKADAKAHVAQNGTRKGSTMDRLADAMKRPQGATLAELKGIAAWTCVSSMPYRLSKQAGMKLATGWRDDATAWKFCADEAEVEAFLAAYPRPEKAPKAAPAGKRTKGAPAVGSKVSKLLGALREAGEDGLSTAEARAALGSIYVKQAADCLARHGIEVVCKRQGKDAFWYLTKDVEVQG